MRKCVVLCLSIGCGSVSPGFPDAAMVGDDAPDAEVEQPPDPDAAVTPTCALDDPFTTIAPLANVNSLSNDINASLSPDELTIYLSSDGAGDYDLYVASRDRRDQPFGDPRRLVGANTDGDDEGPSITADGLTLVVASNDPALALGAYDIMISTRSSTAVEFGPLERLANVNTTSEEAGPMISPDGLTLYFYAMPEDTELQVATRDSLDQPFGAPAPIDELNTPANEAYQFVTADGLAMYFARNNDIFLTRRDSPGDDWGTPVEVAEVNHDGVDWPSYLSADRCRLYFASNRPGGAEGYDLWVAER
jgi:hypothetical protein